MVSVEQLRMATWQCVHFTPAKDMPPDLRSGEYVVVRMDGNDVTTQIGLFRAVATAMRFPSYFGENWDALDECLRDLEWLPARGYTLIVSNGDAIWRADPGLAGGFVECWLCAAEEWARASIPFHLVFEV
jgi:hypothetical protein